MQNKLAHRVTKDELKIYQDYKNNLKNIQPKVDDKAASLNPAMFYKSGVMESNAVRLSRLDEENFKLIQRINIIYRTQGKIDCYKPKSMGQYKGTGIESTVANNKKIFKENNALLTKIRHAKPKIVSNAEARIHQKKNYKNLMFSSKYPEYLKERIDLRQNYDPLIVNAGLPKNVKIKKSKCYLDIVDSTADRRLGRLTIEVYDGVVPKTADNFLALCRLRGHGGYNGTPFFHIVPGLFCLGGDVQHSVGLGGTSAAVHDGRRCFADENHVLSHNAPGVLSMYNFDRDENASQFLMTFRPLTTMDGRYVVFGRVVHGFDTLELIENSGLPSGKPKREIIISHCGTTLKDNQNTTTTRMETNAIQVSKL